MYVINWFDMQCMHIVGIMYKYLSFLCYAVSAVAATNRQLILAERNNVLNYEDCLLE